MQIKGLMTGIFCGLAMSAFALESASIVIPETTTPPTLDGRLDDPVWQNAATIKQLYLFQTNTPLTDTTVYLARDTQWLYLGFKCVNSNMAHVVQTVFKHDDLYPNFYANESVEMYIRPDATQDRYYWFVLSADNVPFEQRLQTTPVRKQEIGWSAPWRHTTALRPDGWTAEVAIPLFVLGCDDLGGAQINIARNYRAIDLDPYGAKQGEHTVLSTLNPDTPGRGKTHDLNNFQAVSGLGGFKPEIPFAPKIAVAEVTDLQQKEGQYFYDVKLTLARFTPVAGKVKVQIMEDLGDGEVETFSELVDLDGKQAPGITGQYRRELVLTIPAGDLRERTVRVALVDPADGNLLASMTIEDLSVLSVLKQAFVGRSYYSTETNAEIRLELGLPASMLNEVTLIIDANGRTVSEITGLQPVMTPGIPLNELQIGANAVTVRLVTAETELVAKNLNVTRLAPRPGFEVKTDFIKGVMLKDDKPMFPIGMYTYPLGIGVSSGTSADGEEGTFKLLSELGFNTLVRANAYTNADMFMQLADKYDMNVIDWMSPVPKPIGYVKWPPPPVTQPLVERLAQQREWYNELEPELIENARIVREHRNLLGYYNVDEPNLVNPEERIAVAEWYWNTVYAIDPHRPQFLLYSKQIPHGDNWTRWGELLGYDVYPRPFMTGFYSEPGLATAYFAYDLRERCRRDNKVMFFVPIAGHLGGTRAPIGMSKAHMLCQAYTAVIYGARGLLYFTLGCVHGEDAWDALRTICTQIQALTPALVNGDIAQDITYTPENFKPIEQKFPMVNAAVFQYPDGDYLLLAVNINSFAVNTTFHVTGLKRGRRLFVEDEGITLGGWISRLFGSKEKLALTDGSFSDKLEGYGVRAYKLILADNPAPVQVAVDMQALAEEKAPGVDAQEIVRQMRLRKNYIPNPCFKQQFNRGIPDFYGPFCADRNISTKGSAWYVDHETLWNGHPSLRVFNDESDKRWTAGSTQGVWYPPLSDKPVKMTFSFYAKCDKPGGGISFNFNWLFSAAARPKSSFTLTSEWKRYSVTGEILGGGSSKMDGREVTFRPAPGTTLWISGLQLEAGESATEFQDDSVIENKPPAKN